MRKRYLVIPAVVAGIAALAVAVILGGPPLLMSAFGQTTPGPINIQNTAVPLASPAACDEHTPSCTKYYTEVCGAPIRQFDGTLDVYTPFGIIPVSDEPAETYKDHTRVTVWIRNENGVSKPTGQIDPVPAAELQAHPERYRLCNR